MTRTNAFTLVCVTIRVAALWIVLQLLVGLPGYVVAVRKMTEPDMSGAGLLSLVYGGVALAAALFWLFADKIARLTLTRPSDQRA